MKRKKHADPHYSESGGCMCTCRRCVQVQLTETNPDEPGSPIRAAQKCVCRGCTQDCSSVRAVFGYMASSPRDVPTRDYSTSPSAVERAPMLTNIPLGDVITWNGKPVALAIQRHTTGVVDVKIYSPGGPGEDQLLGAWVV